MFSEAAQGSGDLPRIKPPNWGLSRYLEYGGFDDSMIYAEIKKPVGERSIPIKQIMRAEAVEVWKKYAKKDDRVPY
jgi:hypothetical protein